MPSRIAVILRLLLTFAPMLTASCAGYGSGPVHSDIKDENMNRCLLQLLTSRESEHENVFRYCILPVMLMDKDD